jgi:hypothetical protein
VFKDVEVENKFRFWEQAGSKYILSNHFQVLESETIVCVGDVIEIDSLGVESKFVLWFGKGKKEPVSVGWDSEEVKSAQRDFETSSGLCHRMGFYWEFSGRMDGEDGLR